MAINATAHWRVRTDGNAANGAGYDSAIAGAGTDYSDQASPQLSLTDIACSATTTVTSATGGFTAAMIGNAIKISGGGATTGYYFITGHTDTNTITVDRTPGTVVAGTGNVGGASASVETIATNSAAVGNKIVPGNVVWIRGTGGNDPGTDDYTWTASPFSTVSGSSGLPIVWKGYNGRPRLGVDGYFNSPSYMNFRDIVFSRAVGSSTMIYLPLRCLFWNCKISGNGTYSTIFYPSHYTSAVRCHFEHQATKPVSGASNAMAVCEGYGVSLIGCVFRNVRQDAVQSAANHTLTIVDCVIRAVNGIGILVSTGNNTVIANNTIDDCANGISLSSADNLRATTIVGNLISNCTTKGITEAVSRANEFIQQCDYNGFYNNTANFVNLTIGSNSVQCSVDPYTNQSGGDLSLNNTAGGGAALKGVSFGLPATSSTTTYKDIGGAQRQEPAASGTTIVARPRRVM